MDPNSLIMVLVGLVFFILMLASFALFLFLFRPWLRAFLNGVPVPLVQILGMRLRGNPPGFLIDVYLALRHRGVEVTLQEVESTYIARKGEGLTVHQLVGLVEHRLQQ